MSLADSDKPTFDSGFRPRICVWELTLACNARCRHCGSIAGQARAAELDTREALALVGELAALGCESITFSGGEPLLRHDWPALATAVHEHGVRLEIVTNGLSALDQADAIAAADFHAVTLSVDGIGAAHDRLRGVAHGFDRLLDGARALVERGVRIAANTQLNRENVDALEAIHDRLVAEGFRGWQLQLTMAHGRAGMDSSLCIAPEELPALAARICALRERSPIYVVVAHNIGYLGRCEPALRTPSGPRVQFWTGCEAGRSVIGLRSDGAVLGCLSLPDPFVAGTVRERSLAAIWADDDAFAVHRRFTPSELTGDCARCAFGKICRAGCRSLAWSATGTSFSNPYCLHRLERGSAA
jgi:radical SAM protein with 4Fe4S-binding SPASM domain